MNRKAAGPKRELRGQQETQLERRPRLREWGIVGGIIEKRT
jgi:hypothetical protein